MGKLIVLSLDESEKNIYDKILEIVSKADISIYFIANPSHCLDIFRLAWIILYFFPKPTDMGCNIAVILKILPIPNIIINLFFRKRYPLMNCQHIQNTN